MFPTICPMKSAVWRLVAVNLFWGLSFPLVKMWHNTAGACPGGELLSTLTLIGVRYSLAAALMTALWPAGWRAPGFDPSQRRRAWKIALAIGLVYFIGATLQVLAIIWITPAVSAFIT